MDIVSWVRELHTLKFGTSILRREVDFTSTPPHPKRSFVIGGINYPGTGRFTGYEMSELLAGFTDYNIGVASQFFDTFNWETGYFVQDDWKVNRRLTLSPASATTCSPIPIEKHNYQSDFNLNTLTLRSPDKMASAAASARPTTEMSPRGLALPMMFSATGGLPCAAGYGIFYFLDRGSRRLQLGDNPDFNGQSHSPLPTDTALPSVAKARQATITIRTRQLLCRCRSSDKP